MRSEMDSSVVHPVKKLSSCFEISDLLVAYLEQLDVEYVFGVPGGAIEPLYNSLARSERRGGPRAVVARHETGAAFMAAGYALNRQRLGVVCSTTGPGATNLITGVSSAYQNNTPLLVITPQTVLSNFGRGALQESSCTGVNTVGMFEFCTSYNTMVSHADQFERKLYAAITTALQTRTPSHLSIPLDIQRSPSQVTFPSYDLTELVKRPTYLDSYAVEALQDRLLRKGKTVFVIGDGANEAIGLILNVAALLNAMVVATPHGKGIVSAYHPLFRGVIGFAGHNTATQVLSDSEVENIVAIGTTLSEWASNTWDQQTLLNEKLIHVDVRESNFKFSPMANLHVRGSVSAVFEKVYHTLSKVMIIELDEKGRSNETDSDEGVPKENNPTLLRQFKVDEENKYYDNSTPIKPQRLMYELPRLFPPPTRFFADPGNSLTWAIHYLHPHDRRISGRRCARGGLFQSSLEFASMGWAIGASIGAAIAESNYPVVSIIGDGSLLMSGQEITVAVQQSLTVIFVILNDSALGMVKHGQRLANAEQTSFELPTTDYRAFANSMGIHAHIINSPNDLTGLDIETICKRKGPTLLDVRIDGEEVPPMMSRMRALESIK